MLKEKISELEICYQAGDTRKYWKKLKEVGGWKRKGGEKIPEIAVDEEGKEHDGQDALKVWRDSFFQLGIENLEDQDCDRGFARKVEAEVRRFEREEDEEEKEGNDKEEREKLNNEITQEEVNKAINRLKNEKAAGTDRIIGEVLKKGGEMLRLAVWNMCYEAWRLEQVPRDWMQGVIFPLYKDGDNRDPLNYRGITLLSIVGKVYNRVLTERLTQFAEREGGGIVEEQGGFAQDRGSVVCTYRDS